MNCVRVFVWCMLFISGTGPLYLFIYLLFAVLTVLATCEKVKPYAVVKYFCP